MKSLRKFEFIEENGSHSEMEILGCDTRFGTMGTKSPGLGPEE
jgi:hypothetical protein